MTTGNFSQGSSSGPIWITKQWSGSDGIKVQGNIIWRNTGYTDVRISSYYDHLLKKKVYFVKERRWIPPRNRVKITRNKLGWHDYNMTQRVALSNGNNALGENIWGYLMSGEGGNDIIQLSNRDKVELEARLVDKIRAHQFAFAQTIAQPQLTMKLMVSTVQRLAASVSSLKKGNLRRALEHLGVKPEPQHDFVTKSALNSKVAAQYWLEMQYGWKPLLQDAQDAAEAMAYHQWVKEERVFGQVHVKKTIVHKEYTKDSYDVVKYAVSKHTRHLYCRLYSNSFGSGSQSVVKNLGLTDVASLVWETLPWSFVADWFIPFGTYLGNRYQLSGISGQFMVTDFHSVETRVEALPSSSLRYGCRGTNKYVTLVRTPNVSMPFTKPEFAMPNVSLTHFWNSLALLRKSIG